VSKGKPRGGTPIVSMLLSLVLIIIGLATLNYGLEQLNANNIQTALLYLAVTVFTLGFVSFNVLRVRRGYATHLLPPIKVMSIVTCAKCTFKQIRNFAAGDYVFKMAGTCTQCGNPTLSINTIYAESNQKR